LLSARKVTGVRSDMFRSLVGPSSGTGNTV